jgi:hypothetical protein
MLHVWSVRSIARLFHGGRGESHQRKVWSDEWTRIEVGGDDVPSAWRPQPFMEPDGPFVAFPSPFDGRPETMGHRLQLRGRCQRRAPRRYCTSLAT